MHTGQLMVTIFAIAFLSILLIYYYGQVATVGRFTGESKAAMMTRTLATSYIEYISSQLIEFDECLTDTTITAAVDSVILNPMKYLTPVNRLGRDTIKYPKEYTFSDFDDVDDFNGYIHVDRDSLGNVYNTKFEVFYVREDDIDTRSTTPTLVKRVEMKVWRAFPKIDTTEARVLDTVRVSYIKALFRYAY
ncbi:MAG: hypothetical protein N3A63_09305 [Bacteroidetes bacterium]|nr:hypothetical protein [Bacteroidota bacterium]